MFLILSSCILSAIFIEALIHKKLMMTFRNNRYYVFKYLAVNSKNETLEKYILKQFLPKYFGILGLLFVIQTLGHLFMAPADPVICGLIVVSVILLRVYNRTIFSDLWNELSKIQ